MRSWLVSALILAALSVAPVPASAVSCLECRCASTLEIICHETPDPIQHPVLVCNISCGEPFSSVQPNDGDCSLQFPSCTPDNTVTTGDPLPAAAPVVSPWMLPFVVILLSLIGGHRLLRRSRERDPSDS